MTVLNHNEVIVFNYYKMIHIFESPRFCGVTFMSRKFTRKKRYQKGTSHLNSPKWFQDIHSSNDILFSEESETQIWSKK